jgi:flagellar motility protein MotE (MotC chaperone)
MAKNSKIRRKRRQPGRGALVIVATLLTGSALIRLGDNAGQALARATDETEMSAPQAMPDPLECKSPEGMMQMLEALRAREDRVQQQETALQDRMQALKIANQEITGKLTALTTAEEKLRGTIALADSAAEDDLARLTKVYESMKPKQAAALFEEMNPDFAAGFLGRMRPEAAAGIMASLTPQAAHTFSVVMAGRNASVPTE